MSRRYRVSWPKEEIEEARIRGRALHALAMWDICADGARIEMWGTEPLNAEIVRLAFAATLTPKEESHVELVRLTLAILSAGGAAGCRRAVEALRAVVSDDTEPARDSTNL